MSAEENDVAGETSNPAEPETAKKPAVAKKRADAKKPAVAKAPEAETKSDGETKPATETKPAAKKPAAAKKAAAEEPVAATDAPAAEETKEPSAKKLASKEPAASKTKKPARSGSAQPARRRVVRAHARYVRTSARKARMVCGHLRGKSVPEARAILAFTPREVARDWSKLLESAVANAENNHELLEDDLVVREAYADEGPTIKRFRPRAMGRATPIHKRTSHLTITLTPGS